MVEASRHAWQSLPSNMALQPHDERRALARLALHFDRPLMLQDDVLGDGQAEAGAAAVLGAALVDAVEAAEDLLLLVIGDSFAVVADADLARRDVDLDRPGAVLDGVVDHVRQRLLEAQRIGVGEGVLAADDELRTAREVFDQLVAELAGADALPRQQAAARLDAA